jgi:hypothetical protein
MPLKVIFIIRDLKCIIIAPMYCTAANSKPDYQPTQVMMQPTILSNALASLLLSALILSGIPAMAAPPAEFEIRYDAHLGNWQAESERSLRFDTSTQTWHMQATSRVLLLGNSLSTITEKSNFRWQGELPVPLEYSFVQSGIGERQRSIKFDHEASIVKFTVDEKSGQYPLAFPVYDDLSAYLVLRQQLEQGAKDIYFGVFDRDKIETYHYRVLDESTLHTKLGDFPSVHIERVREDGNKRRTEFWLARDQDFLLLKLEQEEPNGRVLEMDITQATLSGQPLQAAEEEHINDLVSELEQDPGSLSGAQVEAAPELQDQEEQAQRRPPDTRVLEYSK